MSFYVVHKGIIPGIYSTWDECKKNINRFSGAIYKKFNNKDDASYFLLNGKTKEKSINHNNSSNLKSTDLVGPKINTIGKYRDYSGIISDGLIIYTDGSLFRLNDKCYSGYGIYIPSLDIKKSYKLQEPKTNNRAELTAIINAINNIPTTQNINIVTDSTYCINIMTTTGKKYKNMDYKDKKGVDVKNKDLIIESNKILDSFNVNMIHVNSHTTNEGEYFNGNKIADKLAVRGAVFDYIDDIQNIDEYIIRFGKYKSKMLKEIDKDELVKYISSSKYKQTCIINENYMIERELIKGFIQKN